MQKYFIATAIILCWINIFSCKKDNVPNSGRFHTINTTIKKNESFQYTYGLIGIEDGIQISKQAKHFQISVIGWGTGGIVYNYKPSIDYSGTDEVEITHYISPGYSFSDSIKTIINLTIAN